MAQHQRCYCNKPFSSLQFVPTICYVDNCVVQTTHVDTGMGLPVPMTSLAYALGPWLWAEDPIQGQKQDPIQGQRSYLPIQALSLASSCLQYLEANKGLVYYSMCITSGRKLINCPSTNNELVSKPKKSTYPIQNRIPDVPDIKSSIHNPAKNHIKLSPTTAVKTLYSV